MANLVVLDLTANPIQNKGGQALAQSHHLAKLRALRLADVGLDEPTLAAQIMIRKGFKLIGEDDLKD